MAGRLPTATYGRVEALSDFCPPFEPDMPWNNLFCRLYAKHKDMPFHTDGPNEDGSIDCISQGEKGFQLMVVPKRPCEKSWTREETKRLQEKWVIKFNNCPGHIHIWSLRGRGACHVVHAIKNGAEPRMALVLRNRSSKCDSEDWFAAGRPPPVDPVWKRAWEAKSRPVSHCLSVANLLFVLL